MELAISVQGDDDASPRTKTCVLNGRTTLGRGPESLVSLDGKGISREHFSLHEENGAIYVTDLSSNGTWLNALRLKRDDPHQIAATDEIRIPGFTIRVSRQGGSVQRPAKSVLPANPPILPASTAKKRFSLFGLGGVPLSFLEKLLLALSLTTVVMIMFYAFSP